MRRWYWLDTKWGCGGVEIDRSGRVVDSAPIFKRLRGQHMDRLLAAGYLMVEQRS